jgi:hypothetical protein
MISVRLCARCAAKLDDVLHFRRSFRAVDVATLTIAAIKKCPRCKAQVRPLQVARRDYYERNGR